MDNTGKINKTLFAYAALTAGTTLALLGVGGVVTSRGVGMAVPDWPTSNGYNMFAFPVSQWIGGVFYEHTHRLVASLVGVLVVGLTRWLGGQPSRLPFAIIGLAESAAGLLLVQLRPELKGAGHFLLGIGSVVLLGAAVWVRNPPAPRPLPTLGWIAFLLVQVQGLLGGLRVVLLNSQIGIFHATLAQAFFVLTCVIAVLCSHWWIRLRPNPKFAPAFDKLRWLFGIGTLLVLGQLVIGATMRHQHAGLAIPDFPLAYHKLWPDMDADSIARYNQQRIEVTAVKPITAFQVGLQMTHRLVAFFILGWAGFCAWRVRRLLGWKHTATWLAWFWLALICLQGLLGAATIWTNKAADIATAHVLGGALSLAGGAILCIMSWWHAAALGHGSPAQVLTGAPFGRKTSEANGMA